MVACLREEALAFFAPGPVALFADVFGDAFFALFFFAPCLAAAARLFGLLGPLAFAAFFALAGLALFFAPLVAFVFLAFAGLALASLLGFGGALSLVALTAGASSVGSVRGVSCASTSRKYFVIGMK